MGSCGLTCKAGGAFVALLCVLALAAEPAVAADRPLPKPLPVASDGLGRALATGRLDESEYALARARSLLDLAAVRREFGHVARPKPHDATLILRDLALRLRELSAADRREARALLARPSDGFADEFGDGWTVPEAPASPVCDAHVCVHWVASSTDAPVLADSDDPADGVPDWVEDVVQPTLANVWATEIDAMGNPAPLSDDTSPEDGGANESDPNRTKLDVYLTNLGDDMLFGYCASDDPRLQNGYSFFDVSAFCVLDDDFADFGAEWTPAQFNQVVTAHEFRHASQFAEDAAEDAWFMEGDAMWIEGEVYPTVTDRFDYLATSPLRRPGVPVDHGDDFHEYGAWIFFRFLSEHYGDPSVVRTAWERADGSGDSDGGGPDTAGPDRFSMQAVGDALAVRGTNLHSIFPTFTRWNRTPSRFYSEGSEYPTPPTTASFTLGAGTPSTGWKTKTLLHLASAYYSFRPGSSAGASARLQVSVELPALKHKPAATVLVFTTSGGYSAKSISLDSAGDGGKTVAFGRGTISRVDLILANASARYDLWSCWQAFTKYSCGGAVALDDRRSYSFRARLR